MIIFSFLFSLRWRKPNKQVLMSDFQHLCNFSPRSTQVLLRRLNPKCTKTRAFKIVEFNTRRFSSGQGKNRKQYLRIARIFNAEMAEIYRVKPCLLWLTSPATLQLHCYVPCAPDNCAEITYLSSVTDYVNVLALFSNGSGNITD